ncbi:uncharacterized protein FOMMEDRAFT_148445, partial [Fomitiporia mediterranea MF3/22]|uniref:uncharacterized protein n=1 Tax=Fomitiporia mediterranea (strain MF3/22) TaxID=694068 RepID=UPI0004408978
GCSQRYPTEHKRSHRKIQLCEECARRTSRTDRSCKNEGPRRNLRSSNTSTRIPS